jgi:hypothetical protein
MLIVERGGTATRCISSRLLASPGAHHSLGVLDAILGSVPGGKLVITGTSEEEEMGGGKERNGADRQIIACRSLARRGRWTVDALAEK